MPLCNVPPCDYNVGKCQQRAVVGLSQFSEFEPSKNKHRQASSAQYAGELGERPRLHEGLAPGERHALDALGGENDGRQVVNRSKVAALERPGVGVPAAGTSEGTALDPEDEPLTGAVGRAAREGAGEVEAHGQKVRLTSTRRIVSPSRVSCTR
ncbi:MAG: hypothetical protein RIT24_3131 [Planctomycetota bacterium]